MCHTSPSPCHVLYNSHSPRQGCGIQGALLMQLPSELFKGKPIPNVSGEEQSSKPISSNEERFLLPSSKKWGKYLEAVWVKTFHSALTARKAHARTVINNVQITRNNSLSWGGSIPCTCSQIAQPPPSNKVLPWVVAQPLWKSILSLSDRKSIKTFPPSTQLPTASLHVL